MLLIDRIGSQALVRCFFLSYSFNHFRIMQEDLLKISRLREQRHGVALDDVPDLFIEDLKNFLLGSTLSKGGDGRWYCAPEDFSGWVHKIHYEGLDYEINLDWTK